MKATGDTRRLRLNDLYKLRNDAYESSHIYKVKTKAFHEKMIFRKNFVFGQKVILFNSRLNLFLSKRSRWYGPYIFTNVYPHGAVDVILLMVPKVSWNICIFFLSTNI